MKGLWGSPPRVGRGHICVSLHEPRELRSRQRCSVLGARCSVLADTMVVSARDPPPAPAACFPLRGLFPWCRPSRDLLSLGPGSLGREVGPTPAWPGESCAPSWVPTANC